MDFPVPQIMEEIVAVARLVHLVPQVVREILEEINDIRKERAL